VNRATPAAALELLRGRQLAPANLQAAGFASAEQVLELVAAQFRMPRLELDSLDVPADLANRVPKQIAEKHRIVPVTESTYELTIATSDPTQIAVFDWLARELKRPVTPVLATPAEIDRAIRRLYEPKRVVTVVEGGDPLSQEALAEATTIVNGIISGAIAQKASDIHIEPGDREVTVRYRVDGLLRVVDARPSELQPAIVSRVKVLAQLDISVKHLPQDGRIKLKMGDGEVDLRVSVLPTFFGEKVVCRILDSSRAALPLDALGFEPAQQAAFQRMISAPNGLLLVTGPTGSGKSTTLYGALNAVRSPELNLVTVEDPVEYQLPGIQQVQVNTRRGLTFATALRSILRQDPDVILIGEIRDHETGVIAAEAALTGHLVMSSLHTNDAVGAITRMTDLGVEPFLIAPSLVGVVAQRLMRKVCTACAEKYVPDEAERIALGITELPADTMLTRGKGCNACHRTGHAGRIAVRELLEIDDHTRALIATGGGADAIRNHARSTGFRSMRFHALKLALAGVTSSREVMRMTRS
jgi:type IV pilus assembly protein PilB